MIRRPIPYFFTLTGLTLFFVFSAFAEECKINFSQSSVSFGRIKQEDIVASQKNWNRMPTKEILANVFCPEPAVMALFLEATSGDRGGIFFGREGRLILVAENMQVDGRAYEFSRTSDRLNFTPAASAVRKGFLRSNEGIVAQHNGAPVRGKQMSFTLKIVPVINSDRMRRVGDNTELESDLAWSLLTMK